MKRFITLLALTGTFALLPVMAQAQLAAPSPNDSEPLVSDRIAAVVNDNIISTLDLQARIKLALLSSGLPATPESVHRLLPQVLRGLIDEQLEMQEAKHVDVTVSQQEIDNALDKIGKDNGIPGGMKEYVSSHGASVDSLVEQVRAALSWNKVIQRELRPRVDVGDDEIDAAIERIRANVGKEEYLVSEIFLAVDSPKDEDQVRQFAENLAQQLKQGANFGAVARQFSQGTGAAQGGDVGWIQEGQFPPELNRALIAMQPNETVGPIRSANGFHILGLRQKRTISAGPGGGTATLALQEAFKPYSAEGKDALVQEAERIRTTINGCANLDGQMAGQFPGWHLQDMGQVDLDKVPDWATPKVRDLPAGKASEPLPTDKGALIFFVCERHVPDSGIDRNAIVAAIGTEKLELQARRLLRDLRQQAYTDVRLNSGS